MKKLNVAFILCMLALLIVFSFAGCDTADIKVGEENGVAYFHNSTITPKMVLIGEEDKEIEDEYFFGNLITAIEGKPVIAESDCNCLARYTVVIKQYHFSMHSHGIEILEYANNGRKYINYIGRVECTQEEMGKLFAVLENVE